jgi:hypothetical protein
VLFGLVVALFGIYILVIVVFIFIVGIVLALPGCALVRLAPLGSAVLKPDLRKRRTIRII